MQYCVRICSTPEGNFIQSSFILIYSQVLHMLMGIDMTPDTAYHHEYYGYDASELGI